MSIDKKNKGLSKLKDKKLIFLALLIVALLATANFYTSVFSKSFDYISAIYASVIVELANKDRSGEMIEGLVSSPLLNEAANLKAQDMAAKGYFAHNSPEGKTPWYWFEQVGYKYSYAGENLAVNFSESSEVDKAWMNSPLHRANIVNKKFKEIGVGMAVGMYEGKETTFVVQLFGTPALELPKAASVVKTEKEEVLPQELATDVRVLGSEADSIGVASNSVPEKTSRFDTLKYLILNLFSFMN